MADVVTCLWPLTQIKPYLDYLHIECGLADNTVVAYRSDLQRFAGYCLDNDLTDPHAIDPPALQNYLRYLFHQQLASTSIARHLVAVRMFLRYHVLFGLLDKDICSVTQTPKTWQRLPKVINPKQTIDLITAADPEDPLYLRDRALMEMLYATGMRASEVAGLNIEDVNFQIGYLRCFGKGHKERIIPVHKTALDFLQQYLQQLRPQLAGQEKDGQETNLRKTSLKPKIVSNVFISRTGRPLSRIEVWRIVRKVAIRAGMTSKITPHTLRHCFGSHLLQGGADLRSVQEMLGHANVTTTQIYTHVDQDRLRSVHKKYHPRP